MIKLLTTVLEPLIIMLEPPNYHDKTPNYCARASLITVLEPPNYHDKTPNYCARASLITVLGPLIVLFLWGLGEESPSSLYELSHCTVSPIKNTTQKLHSIPILHAKHSPLNKYPEKVSKHQHCLRSQNPLPPYPRKQNPQTAQSRIAPPSSL